MISSTDPLSQLVGGYLYANPSTGVTASSLGSFGGLAATNASNVQSQIAQASVRTAAEVARATLYTNVATAVNGLSSLSLADQQPGALIARGASSSNAGVLTAQATSTAQTGTFQVTVSQLATSQANVSQSYSSASTPGLLGTGSLQITPNGGATSTFTIDGTTSLTSLASAINSANAGVQAIVQHNGDGTYALSVQGTATGASNTIAYAQTGSTSLSLGSTQTRAAQDAAFTVDGRSMSSATNTVTSVEPGLTLNLVGASASPATVTVATDSSQLSAAIVSLVNSFNAVVSSLATAQSSGAPADNLLDVLSGALSQATGVLHVVPGSVLTSLPDLGVTQQVDGTLSINADQLLAAIARDPDGVAALVGGGGDSIATTFGALARDWGGDGGGLLPSAAITSTLDQQRADPVGNDQASTAAYALTAYQTMQQEAASQQQVALAGYTLQGMLLG